MLLVGERRAKRGRQIVADTAASRQAVPLIPLPEIPQPMRPAQSNRSPNQRPVLVLDLVVNLGAHARGRDRARIPSDRRVGFRLLDHRQMGGGELLAAGGAGRLAAFVHEVLHRLGQHGQRRLAIACDVEIDILPAAKILIIGFQVEIAHAKGDDFGPRLGGRPRLALDPVAERIDRTPQVVHLDRQDDIGLANQGSVETLVERVPRWKVHAASIVDDAALQRLGKVDKARDTLRRASYAIADNERVLRLGQHFRSLRERCGIALGRDHLFELGNTQTFRIRDRVLLQFSVERDEDRAHRRCRCNLVSARRRLGEMLQ